MDILIAPLPKTGTSRPSLSMWTSEDWLGLARLVHVVKKGVSGNNRWEGEWIHKKFDN